MGSFGRLEGFDPAQEDIEEYIERFELYCTSNGLTDADKKKSTFLTSIGRDAYHVVRGLTRPGAVTDKTLDELQDLLKSHYAPARIQIAERFKFYRRQQNPGESVVEFLSALRQMAGFCNFGDFLDDALRDRLVCGLRNPEIQRKLLAVSALTLDSAFATAQAEELAQSGASLLRASTEASSSSAASVAAVSEHHPQYSNDKLCYRCNGKGHSPQTCRFRSVECRKCGKKGHIAVACRSVGLRKQPVQQSASTPRKQHGAHHIVEVVNDSDIEPDADGYCDVIQAVDSACKQTVKPLLVTMKVNDQPMTLEVDTGATMTVVPESVWKSTWPTKPVPTVTRLCTYGGSPLDVVGEVPVSVEYRDQYLNDKIIVVRQGVQPLLGRKLDEAYSTGLVQLVPCTS